MKRKQKFSVYVKDDFTGEPVYAFSSDSIGLVNLLVKLWDDHDIETQRAVRQTFTIVKEN